MKQQRNADTTPDPIRDALAEVGAAVFVAQMFELLFVAIAKGILKKPEVASLAEMGEIAPSAFKQRTAALLKELSAAGQFPKDLGERIERLVDDRHALIHRMFLSEPWPAETEFWAKLNRLSRSVFSESATLIQDLYAIFFVYCEHFPDASDVLAKYKPMLDEYSKHVVEIQRKLSS